MCVLQLSRTKAHHPATNGLVERFHRTLKAAIMCHADQQWTEALPLVLLGIHISFKEDLQASVAELMYGEPLRIPGELLRVSTQWIQRFSSPSSASTWPATSSGSSLRLPGYIRAQGPREVHPLLPPSGRNAPGLGAPIQQPLPGPVMER
jgi:hypothetical protein